MAFNRKDAKASHSDEKDEKKGIPVVERRLASRIDSEIDSRKRLGRENTLSNILTHCNMTIETPFLRVLKTFVVH